MIGEIVGEVERRLGIAREVTANSLRTALALDGKLDRDVHEDFLDRVLSPVLKEIRGQSWGAP